MLTTPIDVHLPLVIALVLVCAWVARGTRWTAAVQCAVPLLIVVMMTLTDERTRLLAYGVIVAIALGIAAIASAASVAAVGELRRPTGWPDGVPPPYVALTVVGIVLLRWIPLHDVRLVRELVVLAGSIALLFALPRRRNAAGPAGGTPVFLIAVLAVAVATPVRSGAMTFLPFAVALLVLAVRGSERAQLALGALLLVCAYFARYSLATVYVAAAIVFLVPLLDRIRPLAYAAALVVFALWPWSGIVARALPLVRNYEPPTADTQPIARALATAEVLSIAVPPHVRTVVVTTSGGQVSRFRAGRVIGAIEATDLRGRVTMRPIRIGDVADFGFTRHEQFFGSRNPLPRFSPGQIRDYGANAWVWGAGRTTIACAADIASLRVIAAADLPLQSHLQVDSVEFSAR